MAILTVEDAMSYLRIDAPAEYDDVAGIVSTVEDLLAWLEAHNHPAMVMDPMF